MNDTFIKDLKKLIEKEFDEITYQISIDILELNYNEYIIKDIACGKDHSLALTFNGDVYSWGSGIFYLLYHYIYFIHFL